MNPGFPGSWSQTKPSIPPSTTERGANTCRRNGMRKGLAPPLGGFSLTLPESGWVSNFEPPLYYITKVNGCWMRVLHPINNHDD